MFKKRDHVDVLDLECVWREAIIIHLSSDNYKVRFRGWSPTWDEYIPKNVKRILPAFTILTDWRKNLKVGDWVEIRNPKKSTWEKAMVGKIDNNNVECICGPHTITLPIEDDNLCCANTHFKMQSNIDYFYAYKFQPIEMYYAIINNSICKVLDIIDIDHNNVNNIIENQNKSPLMVAISEGCFEIFELLLKKGANPHYIHNQNQGYLHYIICFNHYYQLRMMKKLILIKVNVNQYDQRLNTPLHKAAMRGNVEICKLLLLNGANVNALDINKVSPLRLAVYRGEVKTVKLLLSYGGFPFQKDLYGINIQQVTCLYRNANYALPILELLLLYSYRYQFEFRPSTGIQKICQINELFIHLLSFFF
jgi:hypothetical protein